MLYNKKRLRVEKLAETELQEKFLDIQILCRSASLR